MLPITPHTFVEFVMYDELLNYCNAVISKFFGIYNVPMDDREDLRQEVLYRVIKDMAKWKYDQATAHNFGTYPAAVRKILHVKINCKMKDEFTSKSRKCRCATVYSIELANMSSDQAGRYDGQPDYFSESDLKDSHLPEISREVGNRVLIDDIKTKVLPKAHPDVADIFHALLGTGDSVLAIVERFAHRNNISKDTIRHRWKRFQFDCHLEFNGRLDDTFLTHALTQAFNILDSIPRQVAYSTRGPYIHKITKHPEVKPLNPLLA